MTIAITSMWQHKCSESVFFWFEDVTVFPIWGAFPRIFFFTWPHWRNLPDLFSQFRFLDWFFDLLLFFRFIFGSLSQLGLPPSVKYKTDPIRTVVCTPPAARTNITPTHRTHTSAITPTASAGRGRHFKTNHSHWPSKHTQRHTSRPNVPFNLSLDDGARFGGLHLVAFIIAGQLDVVEVHVVSVGGGRRLDDDRRRSGPHLRRRLRQAWRRLIHAGRTHAGRSHAWRTHAGRSHAWRTHAGRAHAGRSHSRRSHPRRGHSRWSHPRRDARGTIWRHAIWRHSSARHTRRGHARRRGIGRVTHARAHATWRHTGRHGAGRRHTRRHCARRRHAMWHGARRRHARRHVTGRRLHHGTGWRHLSRRRRLLRHALRRPRARRHRSRRHSGALWK